MKRCPSCNKDYFDETLEFCLDDGKRLFKPAETIEKTMPIESTVPYLHPTHAETVELRNREEILPTTGKKRSPLPFTEKKEVVQKSIAHTSRKILETAPIVFALAHNYWQWLYLSKQPAYDLTIFFTSYSFLIWAFLLFGGLLFGLFSLKYSNNKGFAVTSLVVLAINVILSIVPK